MLNDSMVDKSWLTVFHKVECWDDSELSAVLVLVRVAETSLI